MTEPTDVIVIGAGHNGLVCATYLARAGMKVTCLEAGNGVGGMAARRTVDGNYHFPGLAHTACPVSPQIVRELALDRCGYANGPAIDTIALSEGGRHLTIESDRVSGEGLPDSDADAYPRFMREYLAFAKALRPLFENRPPRLKDMDARDRKTLARLGWNIRMGLGRDSMYEFLRVAGINIYDVLNERFEDDRLTGALAADAVLGCAMGPRTPGSVLAWMQRLYGELQGARAVQCAADNQLVGALTRAADAARVSIRLDARVRKIRVENGKVSGVELATGETLHAQTVVSNVDPRATFLDLVGAPALDATFANRVTQIRGAGTVARLHLALGGLPKFTGLAESASGNRLLVAPSMKYVEHAFNHSKYGECPQDPVLELTIPSLHDETLAPRGHHVMSVNVAFVPCDLAAGWPSRRAAFLDTVISKLERLAPDLRSLVVAQEFLTPRDIEEQYGAVQGHWHHGELTLHQSFMMRPLYGAQQYDTPIDNLYLCSAGCHPGGGLTGLPGRGAARRVLEAGRAS